MKRLLTRGAGFGIASVSVAGLCALAFGLPQGRAAATTITFRSPATASVVGGDAANDAALRVDSSFTAGGGPDLVSVDVRISQSTTNKVPAHSGGTCAGVHGYSQGPSDPTAFPSAALLTAWSPLAWNGLDFALPTPQPQQFGIDGITYRDSQSLVIVKCRNVPNNGGVDVTSTHTDVREFTGTFSVAALPDGCYSFDVVHRVFGYAEIDAATVSGGFAGVCVAHQDLHLTRCLTGAPLQFSGNDSINVSIGWASLQQAQLEHFLDVQNGSFSITDAGGATVFSTSWPTGDRSHWSWPPSPTTVYPNGPGSQGKQALRIDFGSLVALQPGTYALHARFDLVQGVNDGFGAISPGPWLTIDSCPFTVS